MALGTTGAGHTIYGAVRVFQLFWGLMSASEFDDVRDWYKMVSVTGTLVASLPDLDDSSYAFKGYTGCTLREPEAGQYFTEHVTDVTMMVQNIKT